MSSQPHILCRHVRKPSLRHAVLTRLRYGDLGLRALLCPLKRPDIMALWHTLAIA